MGEAMSKSERTRQFIVEQTAPVFNEKGYAGTSITDLTNATRLTKGSIYGNFNNKDEVALAAFDYNFGRVTHFIKGKILEHENAIDRLLVYPAVYRDILKIPFLKSGCPILNTATEADDTHPELKARAANALAFWKTSLQNQIERGMHRGEIKNGTNPATVALVLMSLIEGAVMMAKVTGKKADLNMTMNFLEQYITDLKA
jgi:AcrR family transcriptional regulator